MGNSKSYTREKPKYWYGITDNGLILQSYSDLCLLMNSVVVWFVIKNQYSLDHFYKHLLWTQFGTKDVIMLKKSVFICYLKSNIFNISNI